ncbi:helix-turn-helix transcriptional regulator [Arsenophonus apicola]|uniref:Helix-turn-helix transcriptional regulator n=1 Tax=Arsenophonus apicola TaxID=2879119 RepID=A0ABY8P024_9GAMM|nr:helix-turn-helix transcriptional regulator [Arsenophonus apicola]WGO82175.1 helix-turn-helix transcriptional regulator [Arsenophonus apicola]
MINEYIHSSKSLVSYIKNSSEPWYIKDLESRCIYANKADLTDLNLPENYNYEGKRDDEIPAKSCQELWEDFIRDDKLVITENKAISGVEIASYGKEDGLTPRFFVKSPLYDENNKIIGLIGHSKKIDTPTLLYYMNRLNRKIIQFDAPNDIFTKRELEVIFWAQQRLTSKEIAKRLDIFPSTVESHLKNIYRKADINSIFQLIEYCKHTGLDAYIPANFIRKGVQLIA